MKSLIAIIFVTALCGCEAKVEVDSKPKSVVTNYFLVSYGYDNGFGRRFFWLTNSLNIVAVEQEEEFLKKDMGKNVVILNLVKLDQ